VTSIDLEGRVAVVTGAGRGLGRAYAEALAAAGAAVVVNDIDAAAVDEVTESIRAAGGQAVGVVAAVGPTETADLLVRTAREEFERIDAMVANAGVLRDRVLWKMSDEDFDLVIGVHLRGAFTCGRAAAVAMREQGAGGRIILVGSPAGQFGSFGQTNYASAKAGLVAMARTWSLELARSEITVNAIVPTAMTEMTGTIPIYAELYQRFLAGEPVPPSVRREHALGGPEDAAPLVVWLASAASGDVTGQAIGIGGDRLTLYAHPSELEVAYRDGGWTADAIDAEWHDRLAASAQTSGPDLKPLDP
jgi:NAD(P)-dependent dehydrogenase (short-subunit alcohol dehydrogenase family)